MPVAMAGVAGWVAVDEPLPDPQPFNNTNRPARGSIRDVVVANKGEKVLICFIYSLQVERGLCFDNTVIQK